MTEHSDQWLERWLPLVTDRAAGRRVLELGCGNGRDTEVLADSGQRVIAIDRSRESIAEARLRVPGAEFYCQDFRDPFPVQNEHFGVVVASLSLHYFPWAETARLLQRIRKSLAPTGVLLCRVNSTNDENYGATGHPPIGRNYYLVDGQPKRFFDRESIHELLSEGWSPISVSESSIDRYALPKSVWEVVAEADA